MPVVKSGLFSYPNCNMTEKNPTPDKGNDFHSISSEKARSLRDHLPPSEAVQTATDIFQTLSDPKRVKILHLLSKEELCVHDLTTLLGCSQSSISHHLKILRMQKLVKKRKEGRVIYYSLIDSHVLNLVEECLTHANH